MRIVIPGGSGQVGTLLARAFHRDGHDVTVLSRSPKPAPWKVARWEASMDGADVVINLAGRSVNCRYTKKNREEIVRSRLDSVAAVGRAIAQAKRPPAVWLQATTATIYAHTYGDPHDEATGVIGGHEPNAPDTWRFSIDVATAWERALVDFVTPGTRKVLLRSAMTMSPDRGGVFATLATLTRFGLGGSVGHGRQYVSWIHEADFIRAIYFLIDHTEIDGPVNLASPSPLPYRDFMSALRHACGMPFGLPATTSMLEFATFLLRTESELVLKSRRVVPGRLLNAGFRFEYPEWADAARELCGRWKAGARTDRS